MSKKLVAVLSVFGLMLASAVALTVVTPAVADKDGCPNDASANRAAHANANSAHGSAKQEARHCTTVEPTPEPTPTPPPTDTANVRVVDVAVTAPETAPIGKVFSVHVGVRLNNDGPVEPVLVDTTVNVSAPTDCVLSPADPVIFDPVSLDRNVEVYMGRYWHVECALPDAHSISAEASANIAPLQGVTDPNLNDNLLSDTDTTQVGS